MFTGLVQDIGRIEGVSREGQAAHFRIATHLGQDLRAGDSLAVNGVCLTVTEPASARVRATAVAETLERSTLGALRSGDKVHLEPALRLGDAVGGHIVQGHVDGIGQIETLEARGVSLELTVVAPEALMRYMVDKGSIAIDGASLTIARLGAGTLTVALIPHTLESTTCQHRRAGQAVNLEVDVLGKYVERMLGAWRGDASEGDVSGGTSSKGVDLDWLRKHGFA